MVGSLLKKANLSTPHCPSTCAAIFFYLLTPPRFGALNRESESSGSQPVYRKLFPRGPHSSKNNFFEIKISQNSETPSLSYYAVVAVSKGLFFLAPGYGELDPSGSSVITYDQASSLITYC